MTLILLHYTTSSLHHSLTPSLPHCLTHSRTHIFIYSHIHVLTYSRTHIFTYSHIHILTYSRSHSLTHLLTHLLIHLLTHSPLTSQHIEVTEPVPRRSELPITRLKQHAVSGVALTTHEARLLHTLRVLGPALGVGRCHSRQPLGHSGIG